MFAELTPTRVALSEPGVEPGVAFHTACGTIAGLVAPEVSRVRVERIADRRSRASAVVSNGVFVAPNAFSVVPTELVLYLDNAAKGRILSEAELPARAHAAVDRPSSASEPDSAFIRHLTEADTPPVVDAELWRRGVSTLLTDAEHLHVGHYGRLLSWHTNEEDPFVFGPRRGPVRDFITAGRTLVATRLYYDDAKRVAVIGLLRDGRVAAVLLRRDGEPDLTATTTDGTFLLTGTELVDLREHGRVTATLLALDDHGDVPETVPYQQT